MVPFVIKAHEQEAELSFVEKRQLSGRNQSLIQSGQTTMPGGSGATSPLSLWPAKPPGSSWWELAASWALNCPGDWRNLLLVVDHCHRGDTQLSLSVLHSYISSEDPFCFSVSLSDTNRKRHYKGKSFSQGWEISALPCSTFSAQLFSENGMSGEPWCKQGDHHGSGHCTRCCRNCQFGSHVSPDQERGIPALCLCVLLFPCKTLLLVKQQRRK